MSTDALTAERLAGALVAHDADPPRPPLRHPAAVAITGLLIAALLAAAAATYGLVTGMAFTSATDTGAILLDRGSGALYVFRESDHRLHPVPNYVSGLLLATGAHPRVRIVPAAKLAAVPLGEPLGIPGAPDVLPPASALLTGDWSVCTAGARGTVLVGVPPSGGTPLAGGLLARDPAGRTSLIYAGHRYPVSSDRVTAAAHAPWPVAAAWLAALPAGSGLPAPFPQLVGGPASACVSRSAEFATVRVNAAFPVGRDGVVVPRGAGAVVADEHGTVNLVTDAGIRYPLASPDLLSRLGYPGVRPTTVPDGLLSRIPAGPALDTAKAG
ncbi:type VII secretion protein EccB [Actinoplanes sp. NPDC051851]|uniref:type VII secretion protein EccB n=1 Tax=Actinoplanes sp. NPDC051851 TaxID=3154753 RepID=UPI00341DE69A